MDCRMDTVNGKNETGTTDDMFQTGDRKVNKAAACCFMMAGNQRNCSQTDK